MFEVSALQELKQAIKQQNLLMSGLLLAKHFQPELDIAQQIAQIENCIIGAGKAVKQAETEEQRFQKLVDYFYTDLAFSGDEKDYFASKHSLLNRVIDYRTGIPVSLAMIFCQIGNAVGFKMEGINFPGHFLVKIQRNENRSVFMDPLNGCLLNWQTLEQMYKSILGEQAEDEMPADVLEAVSCEDTIIRLLHNLKAAFIKEEMFQHALSCVDLLVQLCPEDPYERRDRGFLLHQLECPQLALADYRYFIKHCPQDPSAQMLKIQLKHLQHQTVVLH